MCAKLFVNFLPERMQRRNGVDSTRLGERFANANSAPMGVSDRVKL